MGVETKKMANSIAAAGGNFGDRIKSWPERVRTFYNDVRTEMRKVTAPSWKEVRATTAVVVITVFIFAVSIAHQLDYRHAEGLSFGTLYAGRRKKRRRSRRSGRRAPAGS